MKKLPRKLVKLSTKAQECTSRKKAQKILKKYEKLGYDEFSYWIDSGMSYDMKVASLEHFIKKVIPAFQS